jgi:hypothetical protein
MTSECSIPDQCQWSDQLGQFTIPDRPRPHPNLGWGKIKIKKSKQERAAAYDQWKALNPLAVMARVIEKEEAEARVKAKAEMVRVFTCVGVHEHHNSFKMTSESEWTFAEYEARSLWEEAEARLNAYQSITMFWRSSNTISNREVRCLW